MSIGSAGGSTPPFTASELVPLYALMSGTDGAASPELVLGLEAAAQFADRAMAEPTGAPVSTSAPAAGETARAASPASGPGPISGSDAGSGPDAGDGAGRISVYA